MHLLGQQFLGDFLLVVDLRYSNHGIPAQMRIDDNRLRVGIADNTQSLVAVEGVQFVLELRAEIVAFQTVDRPAEAQLLVKGYHTGTLGA